MYIQKYPTSFASSRSLYHFDPSNPPTKSGRYGSTSRKKLDKQKSLTSTGKSANKDAINTTNNPVDEKSSSTNSKLSNHPKVNISNDDDDNDDDDVGQTDSLLDTSMKSHHHQQTLQDTKDNEEYENNKCE